MKYLGYTLLGLAAVLWLGPLALAAIDFGLWFIGINYSLIDWDDGRKGWTTFVALVTFGVVLASGLS